MSRSPRWPRDFAAIIILGGTGWTGAGIPAQRPQRAILMCEFARQDKGIRAIGHGIQALTGVGLTKGRTMICHAMSGGDQIAVAQQGLWRPGSHLLPRGSEAGIVSDTHIDILLAL